MNIFPINQIKILFRLNKYHTTVLFLFRVRMPWPVGQAVSFISQKMTRVIVWLGGGIILDGDKLIKQMFILNHQKVEHLA